MKEIRKIGYISICIGAISTAEAWRQIDSGLAAFPDIAFLVFGLIASLAGIHLVLKKDKVGLGAGSGQ